MYATNKLESGNYLVLDVISGATFRKPGFTGSILPPYYCVARCFGNEWLLVDEKTWVIKYEAPNLKLMQFLSLEPILLTLPERQENCKPSSGGIQKLLDYKKYQVDKARLKSDIDQINLYYKYLSDFKRKFFLTESLPKVETFNNDNELQLPCQFYPDYIRFYNTIWLIINDISFGLILGALMFENQDYLVNCLHGKIRYCLYDFVKKVTIGLADNPFGIKLNAELTHFLSELFLWIIDFSYLHIIEPLTEVETLSKLINWNSNVMSFVGATFGLSLVVDFLSLCGFHIFLFYHIINKLYAWQLNAMTNLYYLFRGKKKNKLRNRIDFNHFELDQLLMGMLLFIIMVYLTPTILAFYVSYTGLRILLIYAEISFEAVITLINHFPLFALLLRMKDPKRLPGGISFDLKLTTNGSYLFLRNNPLKMGMLFKPFTMVLNRILDNYCSIHTLINIIKGRPIIMDRHKLYQVLYSSLPKEPVNINETFKQIFDTIPV
ncbi:hypothetical protein RI543_004111 [Arxiozyma heterogenica]|uniref:Uncharacterized protein n=1 Tax=Arxiozyma heterogenica TaxID=278026 RepID=A0AAN7W0E3_9SACH|nr:hypothetical protein RI543_004111 [Kazachstania heterogenica]